MTIRQAMDIADTLIQQKNVPVEVVLRIMKQESEFAPEAVIRKGGESLMQVMRVVWKSYSPAHCKNPTGPILTISRPGPDLGALRKEDWRE